jgi:ABC-type bacteriocin/lantibiotic exporter with double-glycine peptidase domain
VEIWDPNPAENRRVVDRADFVNIWTGYVLLLNPDVHFTPKKEKGNILFKYAPLLFPYKKNLILVCIASTLLILLGIATSFFYKRSAYYKSSIYPCYVVYRSIPQVLCQVTA